VYFSKSPLPENENKEKKRKKEKRITTDCITIYASNTVALQLILKFLSFKVVLRWFLVVSFAVVILIFRTKFMLLLL